MRRRTEAHRPMATDNNLRLNQAKTVEIVFYARGRHHAEDEQPPSLPGIQRISSIIVLGVIISNNLSMAGLVSALLDTCARTLYGLRVLRAHGLHQDCLDEVFRCTVLAKLLYASPRCMVRLLFCSRQRQTLQVPQQM